MRSLRLVLPLSAVALVAALAFVGCSGDGVSTPAPEKAAPKQWGPIVGPSEIVLCLDLSDSTSSDELDAMLAALEACLSDAALIPRDGNVALAGVAYGDTAIAFLDTAIAVTDESLQQAILPALQGLANDRLVGQNGYDLSGALDAAAAILAVSTRPDLHVLILGSGAADDEAAVAASCAALEAADVMISAVAPGDGPADLFEQCAAGGGIVTADCGAALAYMLQVELDLGPDSAERARGEEHAVTAMVFRGGDADAYPVVGHEVGFSVVDGPNNGAEATALTDTLGAAHFAYLGDGGPGTDTIVAESVHPGTGVAMVDTVTVTWANAAPVCDAGGPYFVDVTADTVVVELDASASFDADGDTLTFAWSLMAEGALLENADTATPTLTLTGAALCADTLRVDLTVGDGFDTSECTADVILNEMRPVVVELAETLQLWPVNHKYVTVGPEHLIVSFTDACGNPFDPVDLHIVEVSCDEPEDGLGSGSTDGDIVVLCPDTVDLRAERMGGEMGRVYTIVYGFTGLGGEMETVTAIVEVPHDDSGAPVIPNEGIGYTITPDCGTE